MSMLSALSILSALVVPLAVDGQRAQARLSPPLVATDAAFTSVSGAIRLADGSWIVSDAAQRELWRVHGATGQIRPAGAKGSGPGEYRVPQTLLPLRSGQFLLVDQGLRRVSLFSPNGAFVRSVPYPAANTVVALSASKGVDDEDVVYFVAPLMGDSPQDLPVFAWKFPNGELKRVLIEPRLNGPRFVHISAPPRGGASAENQLVGISKVVPYSPEDAFVVLTNGELFIARSDSRQVEWRTKSGVVVEVRRIPGERARIPDSVRTSIRPIQVQDSVSQHYPAFDANRLVRSAGNRVWLRTYPNLGDSSLWLGYSRSEPVPQRLMLHHRAHIVAVVEPWVAIARRNDDDLQRFEVFRLQGR